MHQSTTDPDGAAAQEDAREAALYRSLVDDAFGFTVAIRDDFTIRFVSRSVWNRTGRHAHDLVGRSVADFLHPEDLERALLLVEGWQRHGAPNGLAGFRIQHADGTWVPFDVTGAHVTDGVDGYLAVHCNPVDYQHATEAVLTLLLDGAGPAKALESVLDVFSWELNLAQVAITWFDPDLGPQYVSTGIPGGLAGAATEPGEPWATARSTFQPVLITQDELAEASATDPGLAELALLAARHERGSVWVAPVADESSGVPALVTVWSCTDGPRPDGHAYGMSIAQTYIELILRWSSHLSALNQAALHDQLTGLPNRKRLFDVLKAGSTKGALLFCDLDHFKPVNDAYGHAAGDEMLCLIARRIEAVLRADDLIARTGGDEFVVLAPGATLEQAAALAQRIRSAVATPAEIGGHTITVGVTIGVAHAADLLSEASLAGADQALMLAKANAKGTVRWAPGPMPPDDQVARPDTSTQ